MTEKPGGTSFFSAGGSQSATSYEASVPVATLAFVAGYHTSTGASFVGRDSVDSPTPNGPGRVKLLAVTCATTGTVSPRTTVVPGSSPRRACAWAAACPPDQSTDVNAATTVTPRRNRVRPVRIG